jgi:hypothetical protein
MPPMTQALAAITISRRTIDVAAPSAASIAFDDIAEHLSRICRYAGAVNCVHYSVAQHSCLVADTCERLAPGTLAAVYGQLHDAHEYVLGDVSRVLESHLDESARAQIEALRNTMDAAIHRAAGLAWPPPPAIRDVLAAAHARVEAAEVFAGIANVAAPPGVAPAVRTIPGWPQPKAHEKFVESLTSRAVRLGLSSIRLRASA